MNEETKILFVDDEINVLNALKRLFLHEETDMQILTTSDPEEAIEILRNNTVSVIVSDNLMPGMTGIEFLQKAKGISPDSVKILMTAYADVKTAIDAINKGEVYKFIAKPWNDQDLKDMVRSAVDQYNVIHSLRKSDEATLLSLAQTIELKDPYTRGHCDRVAQYAMKIARRLNLPEHEQKYIQYGSWLHDCGKIGVPESILNYEGRLSEDKMDVIRNHSKWGAEVARLARLHEMVINIILYHHERYDGTGYPCGLKAEAIPLEARIVSVADFYDALTSDRPYREKLKAKEALNILHNAKGAYLDPELVEVIQEILEGD